MKNNLISPTQYMNFTHSTRKTLVIGQRHRDQKIAFEPFKVRTYGEERWKRVDALSYYNQLLGIIFYVNSRKTNSKPVC